MQQRKVLTIAMSLTFLLAGCGKSPFVGSWRDKGGAPEDVLVVRKDGTGSISRMMFDLDHPSATQGTGLPPKKKSTMEFSWRTTGGGIEITMKEGPPEPDLRLIIREDGTLVSKSLNAKDSAEDEYSLIPEVNE